MTDEQTIGGILVDTHNLKIVIHKLIDDYTVAIFYESGEIISIDLLRFRDWLDERYQTEEVGS